MCNCIAKKWFFKTALSYLGTPYIWGGDNPSGFDCSGFVVECLKAIGLLHEIDDYTANGLLKLLLSNKEIDQFRPKEIDCPQKGALLFFIKNNRAHHVSICLDEQFHIAATGGNRTITNLQKAWRKNAFVKIRPIRFNKKRMKVVQLFE